MSKIAKEGGDRFLSTQVIDFFPSVWRLIRLSVAVTCEWHLTTCDHKSGDSDLFNGHNIEGRKREAEGIIGDV